MAELVAYYAAESKDYKHIGFVTDRPESRVHLGLPLHSTEDAIQAGHSHDCEIFVAISYHQRNSIRRQICERFSKAGWKLATIISRNAHVASNAIIGENVLILEGTVIQPWSQIGDGVIIWSGVQVGHHSVIDDYAFLSAGVILMGCNSVGEGSHLSGGVVVKDHVEIGEQVQVGPGALVDENLLARQ
jgi:sugar O-acyltransferase (sialic acid O-acetyltransferase NeuD family)